MKKSCKLALCLFALGLSIILAAPLTAQTKNAKLIDYWPVGQEMTYEIDTWGRVLGHSTTTFVGPVSHSVAGNCYLFRTEVIVHDLKGDINSQSNSELFTDVVGLPRFYTVDYVELGDTTSYQGYLGEYEFVFQEVVDTGVASFTTNMSPTTVLCDKQSVAQWNLAFFNEANLDVDEITFSVLIPYLKLRTLMKMERRDDATIKVLGKDVLCKVFYSLRTDEYYYITPQKYVAQIHLPKQGLTYKLKSIKQTAQPESTEK